MKPARRIWEVPVRQVVTIRTRVLAAVLALWATTGTFAQSVPVDAAHEARRQVIGEIVASLPAELPDGALAVLPPEVVEPEAVESAAAVGWSAAVSEALHAARPDLRLVDRAALTAILREQKLGDSAYANPETAVEVGRLVAARTLLLTRLHELRSARGHVRVRLEASLVDVESGENLWSRAIAQGVFPRWAKLAIAALVLALAAVLWRVWDRRRRKTLVHDTVPDTARTVRVDVDGLARSATAARERLHQAGETDAVQAVQTAWLELDGVLERVRHALPGGSVDRSRARDLAAAVRGAKRLDRILSDLRRACDETPTSAVGGADLARTLSEGAIEVRAAVDAYRRHLS